MTDRALTVKQVAERLGIRTHGVTSLIKSGELRAADVSLTPGGRPRWRTMPEDLDSFLLRRTYQTKQTTRRRRRRPTDVKQYF